MTRSSHSSGSRVTVDIRRCNSLIAIGGQPRLWRVRSLGAGPWRVIYWLNFGRILFTCWVTRPIQFHLHESRTDSLVSTHDRSVSREPYLLGPNIGRLVSQSLHHCTPILPCTSFRRHEGECRRVAVVEHVERPVDTQTLVLCTLVCTPVACPAHRHPLPLRLGSGSSRKYRIVVKTLRSPLGPQVASELSW